MPDTTRTAAARDACTALRELESDISLPITPMRELAGLVAECSCDEVVNADRINALGEAIVRLADHVHKEMAKHLIAAAGK